MSCSPVWPRTCSRRAKGEFGAAEGVHWEDVTPRGLCPANMNLLAQSDTSALSQAVPH